MERTVNGLRTYIEDTGPGERGTVLFLNGWNTRTDRYARVFALLHALGWRVVGFDMPGVGRSEEPGQPFSLGDYVAFTLALHRELALGEVVLFGHSHGGRVTLKLLSGQRQALPCRRAVLMDAAGVRFPAPLRKRVSLLCYKLVRVLGTFALTRPLFADLYHEWRDKRASADYRAASPVMRQTLQNVVGLDLRGDMPAITADTLLLWGEHDGDTPLSYANEMARLIPESGLAVIAGAGHFPFEDNWPQFEAVIKVFFGDGSGQESQTPFGDENEQR